MKDTNLKEMMTHVGSMIEEYNWEDNTDNVGLLVVGANEMTFKAGIVGRPNWIINGLVNGMIKDEYLREVIINAHDIFTNHVIDCVSKEKENKSNKHIS